MTVVSLDVARALKEVGYPQDQWPQMVITLWSALGPSEPHWRRDEPPKDDRWIAAPDPLTALMWLEQERGIQWRYFGGDLLAPKQWAAYRNGWDIIEADTPDALILAICQRLAQ